MSQTPLSEVEVAQERLQDDILRITARLLDNYYEEHPRSKAFGCEYDGDYDPRRSRPERGNENDLVPGGIWFLGRANGSDGAEKDCGVDYIVRKHEKSLSPGARRRTDDTKESHYLFGDYGWPRYFDTFRREVELYRDVVEGAVERGILDGDDLAEYDHAMERFEDELERIRRGVDLQTIAEWLRNNDMENLRPVLADDGDDGRVLWQLLHSKNENDEVVDNDVRVPVVSEADELLFAHTVRTHVDRDHRGDVTDTNEYAFGVVIGVDDTDEVYFVHRLRNRNGGPLGDDDTEWTAALVKREMGFDINYDDTVAGEIALDTVVRLQGDLALKKRDYRTELWDYYEGVLDDKIDEAVTGRRDRDPTGESKDDAPSPMSQWRDAHPRLTASSSRSFTRDDEQAIEGLKINSYGGITVTIEDDDDGNRLSTDELKRIQREVGIEEEDVREAFETLEAHHDCSRLTPKRREQIIAHLIEERAVKWAFENVAEMPTREELEAEAEREARETFEDVNSQVNRVYGNHTVICNSARLHPQTRSMASGHNDLLDVLIVPEESTVVVWHDEHENKRLTLDEGVYEFRFLDGHEDGWWNPRQ